MYTCGLVYMYERVQRYTYPCIHVAIRTVIEKGITVSITDDF